MLKITNKTKQNKQTKLQKTTTDQQQTKAQKLEFNEILKAMNHQ